jgi:CheY-like chemotaxis protein/signal transduction histidine kinase
MLAPLIVAALAGPSPLRGFGTLALGLSLLGPGLATIVVSWRGLGAIADDLARRDDGESRQALLRLSVSAAMLFHVAALAYAGLAVQPLVATDVAAALMAWLVLIHGLIVPVSALRRALALGGDLAFLGLFLHWGGAATAPWAALYLALAFDYGLRFGVAALVAAALGSAVGFAAVATTTPAWRDMPVADLAMFAALALLPLYGAALTGRANAAQRETAALRDARKRIVTALGRELRAPLDALDTAAVRLAAQAVREIVAALHDDPPVAQNFVLREALGAAVAMARPRAEASGIDLTFVFDPRLPHVCRGAPSLMRRLLGALLDGALAGAEAGPVAVVAAPVEGEARLRLAVRGGSAADALGRAIAVALAAELGGTVAFDAGGAGAELPLVRDEEAAAPDLINRKVAVVTTDRELAERLCPWLAGWGADAQWFTAADAALASLGSERLVAVLDGRHDPLAALSLAHRLATGAEPAAILFIAPHDASEAVAGLAAQRLAAVIEEPVTETALASAVLSVIAAAGEPASHGAASLALLVADDDAASRERMRAMLERAGHRIELAADGGAALAALDRGGFDAALIELDMPGVSGDAVAKLFRLRHPGGSLPLFALAASAGPEIESRCRDAGFDTVLKRPMDAAAIGSAVAGARAMRGAAGTVAPPSETEVTKISSHPRFAGEPAETVREATIESLRGLGGNDFLAEVVETFRGDAQRLAPRLRQAAERADLAQFAELAHALASGAANVGGVRLTQTLTALEDLTDAELRAAGHAYVEKIESELARLDLALDPFLRAQRQG